MCLIIGPYFFEDAGPAVGGCHLVPIVQCSGTYMYGCTPTDFSKLFDFLLQQFGLDILLPRFDSSGLVPLGLPEEKSLCTLFADD
jgi:hypothetical protein